MRYFRLVIQILYGHADFEVVAVFGKDRVYQFRKYIVAGYRSNHTVFDIVGKFLFRSCRIELKECFQESGSVLNCVGTDTDIGFLCFRFILLFLYRRSKGRILGNDHCTVLIYMNGHGIVFCDCLCLFSLFYLLIHFVGNGKIVRSRLFYIPDQHICNGRTGWYICSDGISVQVLQFFGKVFTDFRCPRFNGFLASIPYRLV